MQFKYGLVYGLVGGVSFVLSTQYKILNHFAASFLFMRKSIKGGRLCDY